MKKAIIIAAIAMFMSASFDGFVYAQGMIGPPFSGSGVSQQQIQEEAEGEAILDSLQAKQKNCGDLSDKSFELMGEYFMGLMMGNSHQAMNTMMVQMMGQNGEEQMHIVMGKRLSSCDAAATFNAPESAFMPMMNMTFGSWRGNATNASVIWQSWIISVLWWLVIAILIAILVKWLIGKSQASGKSALDILKERYAKGEINKEEFERMKKDLE